MIAAWWLAVALAAAPDRVVDVVAVDGGPVERLQISGSGRWVAGVSGGNAFLLDTTSLVARTVSGDGSCTAVGAVPVDRDNDAADWLIVACSDGTIQRRLTNGSTEIQESWKLETAKVYGVWWNPSSSGAAIWVAGEAPSTGLGTTRVQLYSFNAQDDANPKTYVLGYPGFVDGDVVGAFVYVAHSSGLISRQPVTGGTATGSATTFGLDISDIAPSSRSVYAVGNSESLTEYNTATFNSDILLSQLGSLTAVGTSLAEAVPWLVVASDNEFRVWGLASGVPSGSPLHTFAGASGVKSIVAYDGVAFAGGSAGISILTARPWVTELSIVDPSTEDSVFVTGEAFTLSFSADRRVDYEIRVGGDAAVEGRTLVRGSADADVPTEASVRVDESFVEGSNRVWVRLTDAAGETGQGSLSVIVDNAPARPTLTETSLGRASQSLLVAFEGITDADLDHYDVYVSTVDFDPVAFSTGGPSFGGQDDIETPIRVNAAGGEAVSFSISPLTNDVTYYVAVRAIDAGGKEGPMSDVVHGAPSATFTAAELSGETGGSSCATTGSPPVWSLVLALIGLLRRRRALSVALVAASVLGSSASAEAAGFLGKKYDQTRQRGHFGVRYGSIRFGEQGNEGRDPTEIERVYGSSANNMLLLEGGPQFFGLLQVDLGVGFFQELAFSLDADGNATSERTMLTAFPLSAGGTLRLQLLDEQWIVPHGSYGVVYLPWNEKWDDGAGGKNVISGSKMARYYALGGSLLLDGLSAARSSLLEANSGINDAYLTVDWRRMDQELGQPGLDFSGTMLTIGLKLDY